jgi:hypothetical protein
VPGLRLLLQHFQPLVLARRQREGVDSRRPGRWQLPGVEGGEGLLDFPDLHILQPEGGQNLGHVLLLHELQLVEVVRLFKKPVEQAVDAVEGILGQPTRDLVWHLGYIP